MSCSAWARCSPPLRSWRSIAGGTGNMSAERSGPDGAPGIVAAETLPAAGAHPSTATARALYLTGPSGGARHILPEGIVSLGRDAKSTIVVDDPRVSREHVALHVGETITVTDRGSANGTFLERRR